MGLNGKYGKLGRVIYRMYMCWMVILEEFFVRIVLVICFINLCYYFMEKCDLKGSIYI